MIKYTCSHNSDYWDCYMTELWNNYGTYSCKVLLQAPRKIMYINVLVAGIGNGISVVAVPEIGISFSLNDDDNLKDCADSLSKTNLHSHIAVSLVKTIEIMYWIIDNYCERCDCTSNFADLGGNALDFDDFLCVNNDYDDMPF